MLCCIRDRVGEAGMVGGRIDIMWFSFLSSLLSMTYVVLQLPSPVVSERCITSSELHN